VSAPRVAAILHGARWPSDDPGARWRERLSRALHREVEIVLARDEPSAPRGEAACIADALGRTLAPHILVADVHAAPDDEMLRALVDAVADAALVVPTVAPGPRPAAAGDGWAARLIEASASASPPALLSVPVWALQREPVLDAGGIDTSLWSHGIIEDLAARLTHAGARLAWVPRSATPVTAVSYPFAPAVDQFLRWRATLRLTVAHAPSATLGPELCVRLVALLGSAWRATGVDALRVVFGGDWGRASLASRVRTSLGGPPPDALWPADEVGTAMPLAALLAVAHELPALARDREGRAEALAAIVPSPAVIDPFAATSPLPHEDAPAPLVRPRVSVIVVNWNGREHLEACFASLRAMEYPRDLLECICVDNGSVDDSVEFLRTRFPEVRIVALPENRGFTGGNKAGVDASTGDVLLFVNNDMRFEPSMVSRLVDALDERTACAGARVMSWDGTHIDFVRGTASFEARGYQEHFGEPFVPGTALAESFFPNGGAFAVTRAAYDDAGGFDPALFAYYDDVDLGWRLRMAGHAIRTAADAVAYHKHGATVSTQPAAHKRFMLARNALWIAVRNYDDRTLPHVLPAVLMLAGLRVAQDLVWLRGPLRQIVRHWTATSTRAPAPPDVYQWNPDGRTAQGQRLIARLPMPELASIGATMQDLPRLFDVHAEQQRRRRIPDSEVLPFLGRPFDELDGRRSYRAAQKGLIEVLGLRARLAVRPHVVLLTHEALRTNMSGPAIRVLEMARALSRSARVTVVAPGPVEVRDDRVALVPFDPQRPAALKTQAETADALVVQGFALNSFPFLGALVCPIVADLYCPFTIEHLEQARAGGVAMTPHVQHEAASILAVQNAQIGQADFFICASERQRDFWIGALHTAGRVNPRTLTRDADLRSLIDVVPFGLPSEPIAVAAERASRSRVARGLPAGVLKGVHPAIGRGDHVLLWGGSLLDWQDPETLIEAVARLAAHRSDVKLFFMGVKHPNPQVKPMAVVERSRQLAEALGVAGTHVIFNDWVPYEERALYLLEADLGVSTHHTHLETRYAFRTRMLDYLWARLPIVCTAGDYFGDLVGREGLGRAVPADDPDTLAAAIAALLDDGAARQAARDGLARIADAMTWEQVVEPLRRWCTDPTFAADREQEVVAFRAHMQESFKASRWLKRTALSLGVKEGDVEALKRWGPVRAGMTMRNVLAIRKARRQARKT
jgi:GT2 family glycosyltransferase/glycosyltransferase involved in cell wall biosynthesis